MLKPNTSNSNSELLAASKSPSNTRLNVHNTLTLSTNSFDLSNPPKYDSHFSQNLLLIHLDYLRVSENNLSKKTLNQIKDYLFSGVDSRTINKFWHPDPKMPKSKKYQYIIVSKTGIVFGVRKRAIYKGVNTRYVYDIMIDLTGAYFANLTLVEQMELIYYLNSNYKLNCHRIDVAIDDCSRELFPVGQMITAYLFGNNYGFKVIDDSYLDIIDNKLLGTLGIGSRESEFFIRIYTKHKLFVRWETELKQDKAQEIFDILAEFGNNKANDILLLKDVQGALLKAAIGKIDFRDNRYYNNKSNARKSKTEQLPFWTFFLDEISSLIFY